VKRHLSVLAAVTCCWISALTGVGTGQPQAGTQAPAGGASGQPPSPPPGGQRGGPPGTESGFATFQTRCSICHGNPAVERAPTPAAIRDMPPEKIYDALCDALADEARKARLGNGLDADTVLGPIQNRRQYDRVRDILEDTRRAGGRILAGGEPAGGDGYFIPPTVVADAPEDSRLVQEEQFAPLIPVMKFTDVEDALRRANATRYGLAGSVWSSDLAKASAIAARMEVGTAWVNQHRATAANVPFGGAKESGIGRERGPEGLRAFQQITHLVIGDL